MNPFSQHPKEAILEAAATIARQNGPAKFNIRAVAAECGIAIGTIYNFYDSKESLLFAVVDSFWQKAFEGPLPDGSTQSCAETLRQLYQLMYEYLFRFGQSWMHEIASVPMGNVSGRDIGRSKMALYFQKLKEYIHPLLLAHAPEALWDRDFTVEGFTDFILENILSSLRSGSDDCLFLTTLLTKLNFN